MDDVQEHTVSIESLLASYRVPVAKKNNTERGDLLAYFSKKLGISIVRVAAKLKGMQDMATLYYIKSDCDQAEARGIPWGAAFYTALKPR